MESPRTTGWQTARASADDVGQLAGGTNSPWRSISQQTLLAKHRTKYLAFEYLRIDNTTQTVPNSFDAKPMAALYPILSQMGHW